MLCEDVQEDLGLLHVQQHHGEIDEVKAVDIQLLLDLGEQRVEIVRLAVALIKMSLRIELPRPLQRLTLPVDAHVAGDLGPALDEHHGLLAGVAAHVKEGGVPQWRNEAVVGLSGKIVNEAALGGQAVTLTLVAVEIQKIFSPFHLKHVFFGLMQRVTVFPGCDDLAQPLRGNHLVQPAQIHVLCRAADVGDGLGFLAVVQPGDHDGDPPAQGALHLSQHLARDIGFLIEQKEHQLAFLNDKGNDLGVIVHGLNIPLGVPVADIQRLQHAGKLQYQIDGGIGVMADKYAGALFVQENSSPRGKCCYQYSTSVCKMQAGKRKRAAAMILQLSYLISCSRWSNRSLSKNSLMPISSPSQSFLMETMPGFWLLVFSML